MKAVVLSPDLLISVRIADAAERAGVEAVRVDDPADLPSAAGVDVLVVDWAAREPDWARELNKWIAHSAQSHARVILFGPHTDLRAHAEAREAGLGPMWARSKLVTELSKFFEGRAVAPNP